MPGRMPARRASPLTAKSFCSGGLPSNTAIGRERSSGSARRIASTGKSGTKMQAKDIEELLLAVGYWQSKQSCSSRAYCMRMKNCFYGLHGLAVQTRAYEFGFKRTS